MATNTVEDSSDLKDLYLLRDGLRYGPYSEKDLLNEINSGNLNIHDKIVSNGSSTSISIAEYAREQSLDLYNKLQTTPSVVFSKEIIKAPTPPPPPKPQTHKNTMWNIKLNATAPKWMPTQNIINMINNGYLDINTTEVRLNAWAAWSSIKNIEEFKPHVKKKETKK